MQVSHESIYRTLFVQSRGVLRRELTAYLRTGRVIRRPRGVRLPDGNHKADAVPDGLAAAVSTLPAQLARSLTWDQGHEMAEHRRFTIATSIQVYFCDPKAPWQRGSNENNNLLLRQYLPRRLEFRTLTKADFDAIAEELNERPLPTLGFKTPSQALTEVVR